MLVDHAFIDQDVDNNSQSEDTPLHMVDQTGSDSAGDSENEKDRYGLYCEMEDWRIEMPGWENMDVPDVCVQFPIVHVKNLLYMDKETLAGMVIGLSSMVERLSSYHEKDMGWTDLEGLKEVYEQRLEVLEAEVRKKKKLKNEDRMVRDQERAEKESEMREEKTKKEERNIREVKEDEVERRRKTKDHEQEPESQGKDLEQDSNIMELMKKQMELTKWLLERSEKKFEGQDLKKVNSLYNSNFPMLRGKKEDMEVKKWVKKVKDRAEIHGWNGRELMMFIEDHVRGPVADLVDELRENGESAVEILGSLKKFMEKEEETQVENLIRLQKLKFRGGEDDVDSFISQVKILVYRCYNSQKEEFIISQVISALPYDMIEKFRYDEVKSLKVLSKRIKNYVQTCKACQERRTPAQNTFIKSIRPVEISNIWAVDVLGPLPITSNGNRYIFVFSEYVSRWVEAFATEKIDESTTADLLIKQIMSRYGPIKKLISDRGNIFLSKTVNRIYEFLKVNKANTSAHPQTDGLVERFNKTIAEMLSKYIAEKHDYWDEYLEMLVNVYNTSPQASTSVSPFYVMFGREPVSVVELVPEREEPICNFDYAVANRQNKTIKVLEEAKSIANYKLEKTIQNRERKENLEGVRHYQKGMKVFAYMPKQVKGGAKKFTRQWKGPYLIREVRNNGLNVILETLKGHKLHKTFHINQIKPSLDRLEILDGEKIR